MKRKIYNICIVLLFIICLVVGDYLILLFGKTNYYNYQNSITELNTLKDENRVLKKQINEINSINNLDKYLEYDYLKSEVLLRNIYNFSNTITIRYGKNKNIKKGMAVVSEDGLIGVIDKVNKNSSVVKLVTSNDVNISVNIDESFGILNNYDNTYLIAHNFDNYELIMKDDEVYTSGLGLIPEGIYIGKVEKVKQTSNNLEQNVYIKSNNDFNNIKYIAIIKGIKEL